MKKIFYNIFIPVIASQLIGCASITSGAIQNVTVETFPVNGAMCKLTNDKGTWYITSTPGNTSVHRCYSDMTVTCWTNNKKGTISVRSSTKAVAFGNVLAGGIVGGAIDVGTGAAYDYPSLITVPIK